MAAAVRRRRLRLARAAVAVMAVVLVGACSSNPEPAPLPRSSTPVETTSGAPSPVSDPTPTPKGPPTLPAAARGKGPRAAKAFVRYWVEVLDYSGTHGDAATLAEASDEECESCQALIHEIEGIDAAGGYIRGRGWSVRQIRPIPGQPSARPILQIGMFLAPQEMRRRRHGSVHHYEGGDQPMVFHLMRHNGHWVVTQIDQVQ